MNKELLDKTSKFLSYILRHAPQTIGLTLDNQGWARVDELITCAAQAGQKLTLELLQEVVRGNDKQRFCLEEDQQGLKIRAVQGHSLANVQLQLSPKQPPEVLYHGTASRFLSSILEQGLRAGSRHHVHLSQDPQSALSVGQRYGKPVLLEIDAQRMQAQGLQFFQADNGVWLTEAVAAEFIRHRPE